MPQLNPNIAKALSDMNASYRFSHHAGGAGKVTCEVVDLVSKKVFAQDTGESQEDALAKAVKKAQGAERPKTYAQLQAENEALRKQLEGKPQTLETTPNGQPTSYDAMKPTELVEELTKRGLEVPDGHKGSKEWRQEAVELLVEDDQGGEEPAE